MPSVDPKSYMPTKETSTDDLRDEIAQLRAQMAAMTASATTGGGISAEVLEAMLSRVSEMTAQAQDRMLHPDNRRHPGISVYSYPEGDLARPRAELKVPMSWVNYPITTDTLLAQEIDLLNRCEPGEYRYTRTDGSSDRLVIVADRDALGTVNRLHFQFETKERRDTLPSMVSMLRDVLNLKSPEQEELDRLRAELAALKQPVGA